MTARKNAIAAIAAQKVESKENYLEHAGEDIYGSYVFHENAQRQYLAKAVFKKLRRTIEGHEPFDVAIADAVAQGVKEWAMAHGATHYTHWFVPMTGATRREARLLLESRWRRSDPLRIFRQGPSAGRARRELFPLGRHPCHLRGTWLYRMGRHLAHFPPGRTQRRDPHDPDRVRIVHGRGPRSQDPAAPFPGSPRKAGPARPALVRQHHIQAECSPTSGLNRNTS